MESTQAGVPTHQSILKVDIDGLDQAKTRWPRNLCSSKALRQLWRPNLHVVGFIAHGVNKPLLIMNFPIIYCVPLFLWDLVPKNVCNCCCQDHPKVCEGFLILDADVRKDASMEMTVLDKVLDWCDEILRGKNLTFPEHLVIEARGFHGCCPP